MAGTSNPAVHRRCYIGASTDMNSANDVVNEVASCLGGPFRPLGIFWQCTTGVTGATSGHTFTWEPNPGSATGDVDIATWELPVTAADTCGYISFNKNDDTSGTVIGAGSSTGGYGIGGSTRYVGETDKVCGPGGNLKIAIDADASAGVVNYWLHYQELGMGDGAQDVAITRTVPTAV